MKRRWVAVFGLLGAVLAASIVAISVEPRHAVQPAPHPALIPMASHATAVPQRGTPTTDSPTQYSGDDLGDARFTVVQSMLHALSIPLGKGMVRCQLPAGFETAAAHDVVPGQEGSILTRFVSQESGIDVIASANVPWAVNESVSLSDPDFVRIVWEGAGPGEIGTCRVEPHEGTSLHRVRLVFSDGRPVRDGWVSGKVTGSMWFMSYDDAPRIVAVWNGIPITVAGEATLPGAPGEPDQEWAGELSFMGAADNTETAIVLEHIGDVVDPDEAYWDRLNESGYKFAKWAIDSARGIVTAPEGQVILDELEAEIDAAWEDQHNESGPGSSD